MIVPKSHGFCAGTLVFRTWEGHVERYDSTQMHRNSYGHLLVVHELVDADSCKLISLHTPVVMGFPSHGFPVGVSLWPSETHPGELTTEAPTVVDMPPVGLALSPDQISFSPYALGVPDRGRVPKEFVMWQDFLSR